MNTDIFPVISSTARNPCEKTEIPRRARNDKTTLPVSVFIRVIRGKIRFSGLLRGAAGALPFVFRGDIGMRLDMHAVTLVPPVEDRRGDEDRRERTGDDAHEEGEGK